MKVAFHFNADHERFDRYYGIPIVREIFSLLLQQESSNLHLKIFAGDIVSLDYLRDKKNREELWRGFFMPPRPVWQSLRPDFMDFLYDKKIFVIAFEGISARIRDILHEALLNDDTYLGAQQVHEANPIHWVLYGASLIPLFRVSGTDLRLFYSVDFDEKKDKSLAENLSYGLPFNSVTFEELKVRHTILDSYSSYEHASRVANLSTILYDHLNLVSDHLMLRLTNMAPELYENILSLLTKFAEPDTSEKLIEAAKECRKSLNLMAEKLSPTLNNPAKTKETTTDVYYDKLKIYISENSKDALKEIILCQLQDIHIRINSYASKETLDGNPCADAGRLIIGLLIFFNDLISLNAEN